MRLRLRVSEDGKGDVGATVIRLPLVSSWFEPTKTYGLLWLRTICVPSFRVIMGGLLPILTSIPDPSMVALCAVLLRQPPPPVKRSRGCFVPSGSVKCH